MLIVILNTRKRRLVMITIRGTGVGALQRTHNIVDEIIPSQRWSRVTVLNLKRTQAVCYPRKGRGLCDVCINEIYHRLLVDII